MLLRSGRRSRSRSRSPPLKIPRLIRWSKRRSLDASVKDIQMYYRTIGRYATKSFLLNISANDIRLFNKLNYSKDVSHNHEEEEEQQDDCISITRFFTRPVESQSQYLACVQEEPYTITWGNAAVVGSTVYGCYYGRMYKLDLCDPNGGFHKISTPPSCPDPFFSLGDILQTPKLIGLCGLLFYFAGNNLSSKRFADVYDPLTATWSPLLAPKELDVDKCQVLLRASLGESRGKILFYGSHDRSHLMSPTWLYIYNVESGKWTTLPPVDFDISEPMDWYIVGSNAVIKEQDDSCTSMYWLDRLGQLHAFNWETLQVSRGKLVGFEDDDLQIMLDEVSHRFSFFHVIGDLFCLAWTYTEETAYHITFLRVVEDNPAPGSLTAYVVGCIKYTADHRHVCSDAFLV